MTRAIRLPGPPALTALSNLFAVRRDVVGFLSRLAAEHGDIVAFRVGPIRVLLLNHPDHVKDVLVTNSRNFVKGRPLRLAKELLGEGLLTSEGDFHARQSRIVQPALHPYRIDAYGVIMADYAARLARGWTHGATVDVFDEMTRLAAAIAGKTMFNWDMDAAVAEGITRALEEASSLFTQVSIPLAEYLLKLPLPSSRRFFRAKAHLDTTIYGLIDERRREGKDRGDLLSMLLVAQDSAGDGATMTDTQVRDEALTLFLTGLDTVSLALTWTWYLLSQHPAVETALHAELDTVLGDRAPTMDDLGRLRYTRMVFSEAMRLYPPIYAFAREALEPFAVGDYTAPAGTLVLLSPYVLQRDPRFYRDPLRFDPERWNPEVKSLLPKFAYFPFGGGPRGCIGQAYAWQEGMLVIAALAQHWRMRLSPGHPVALRPLVNLRPRYGMRMILERRR